ncbi:hypothetical protein GGF50DRAFT_93056, partial [Schizophyllum commune]
HQAFRRQSGAADAAGALHRCVLNTTAAWSCAPPHERHPTVEVCTAREGTTMAYRGRLSTADFRCSEPLERRRFTDPNDLDGEATKRIAGIPSNRRSRCLAGVRCARAGAADGIDIGAQRREGAYPILVSSEGCSLSYHVLSSACYIPSTKSFWILTSVYEARSLTVNLATSLDTAGIIRALVHDLGAAVQVPSDDCGSGSQNRSKVFSMLISELRYGQALSIEQKFVGVHLDVLQNAM